MRTSQMWNQAFQQIRFDPSHPHTYKHESNIFVSQEMPNQSKNQFNYANRPQPVIKQIPQIQGHFNPLTQRFPYAMIQKSPSRQDQNINGVAQYPQYRRINVIPIPSNQRISVVVNSPQARSPHRNDPTSNYNNQILRINQLHRSNSAQNMQNFNKQSFTSSQKTVVINNIGQSVSQNALQDNHASTQRKTHNQTAPQIIISSSNLARNTKAPLMDKQYQIHDELIQSNSGVVIKKFQLGQPAITIAASQIVARSQQLFKSQGLNTKKIVKKQSQGQKLFLQQESVQLSLLQKYEETTKQLKQVSGNYVILQKKYAQLQNNYNVLLHHYQSKEAEIAQMTKTIKSIKKNNTSADDLQEKQLIIDLLKKDNFNMKKQIQTFKQLHNSSDKEIQPFQTKLSKINVQIQTKNKYIQNKSKQLQSINIQIVSKNKQLQQKNNQLQIINKYLLQKQNELQTYQQTFKKKNQQLNEIGRQIIKAKMQQSQSVMKRSQVSQFQQRSNLQSFQNGQRIMQLQMTVSKLNSELARRQQNYQREVKLSNLRVLEMVDKIKGITAEKDQHIRNLQQKIGLLQSDLNKKQSLVRNLRDQIDSKPKKDKFNDSEIYSSAIMSQQRQGQKQQIKKQIQTLKKAAIERQRQKLAFKQRQKQFQQKSNQYEDMLSKRKTEIQALRRQLSQLQGIQLQNQKLMQVLSKRNTQILQMKELLIQKEHNSGDYHILSKQNDKLRELMIRKNQQISQIAQKLFIQQKRGREIQINYQARMHQFEDDLKFAMQNKQKKQTQNDKLSHSLKLLQANYSDVQFKLDRCNKMIQEYQTAIKTGDGRLREYQEEIYRLNQLNQKYDQEGTQIKQRCLKLDEMISTKDQKIEELSQQLEHVKKEYMMLLQRNQDIQKEREELIKLKTVSLRQIQVRQQSYKQAIFIKDQQIQILKVNYKQIKQQFKKSQSKLQNLIEENQNLKITAQLYQTCKNQKQKLVQRIAQAQMKILWMLAKKNLNYYEPSLAFENQVINNLKQQNSYLKRQMTSRNSSQQIKSRLGQFNKRLEQVVQEKSIKRVKSAQTLLFTQKQAYQQNHQPARSKRLFKQFQQSTSAQNCITVQQIKFVYQQRIGFYKKRVKELQQRLQNHIEINQNMKSTMQQLIKTKKESNNSFYEQEIQRLKKENSELKEQSHEFSRLLKQYHNNLVQKGQTYNYFYTNYLAKQYE